MTPRRPWLPRAVPALAVAASLAVGLLGWPRSGGPLLAAARAEEAWRVEFADVCSRTQDAMSLSDAELRSYVERCDKLKAQVEGLEGPARKVYLRRLQTCRELYQFVLDTRAAETAR